MRRVLARLAALLTLTGGVVVLVAPPAAAHTVAGSGATNYQTNLKAVSPSVSGLRFRVIENGARVEFTYSGKGEFVVEGYNQEPYLRVGDRGVFENLRSPATYINRTRDGVTPPADADPKSKPVWRKISDGNTARWHEHRVHFMGETNPPQVRKAPDERHVIVPKWEVTMTQGSTTVTATGDLVWRPGPSPAPMIAFAVVLGLGAILLARGHNPYRRFAVVIGALVLLNLAHSIGIGFANAGGVGRQLGQMFAQSTVSLPAWLIGAAAVWFLLKRRVDGFFAAVFVGLVVAVVGGLADLTVLSRSQVPFAWSADTARVMVAASLGLGFGVAAGSALAIRRLDPREREVQDPVGVM